MTKRGQDLDIQETEEGKGGRAADVGSRRGARPATAAPAGRWERPIQRTGTLMQCGVLPAPTPSAIYD